MATSSTPTKSQPKRSTGKANGKAAPKKGDGKATGKASKRPTYSDEVKAITAKARAMACPVTKQGPVARQVSQIMTVLGDPRKAIKEAGLSQAEVKKIAQGNGDAEAKKNLRPLGDRVVAAGGAKQWVRGRPLAATLTAWLEAK